MTSPPLPPDAPPSARAEVRNARTNAFLARLGVLAVGILMATGVATVTLQVVEHQREAASDRRADADRRRILALAEEIQDCTTPGADNPCQRRLAAGRRPVSEDNLRASIAVGTCLREGVPVGALEACALAKYREATERAQQGKP